jgi:hypothetical protein
VYLTRVVKYAADTQFLQTIREAKDLGIVGFLSAEVGGSFDQ